MYLCACTLPCNVPFNGCPVVCLPCYVPVLLCACPVASVLLIKISAELAKVLERAVLNPLHAPNYLSAVCAGLALAG